MNAADKLKILTHRQIRRNCCLLRRYADYLSDPPRLFCDAEAAYKSLYQAMNGKTLDEMDTILYPVCALCREHELSGFITGIKLALRLAQELK